MKASSIDAGSRRKVRTLTVLGAMVAALLVWVIANAAGVDVQSPGSGSRDPQAINAGFVLVVSAIAGLAVALLDEREQELADERLLEALAHSIRSLATAVVVLLLSLSAPLSGDEVSGSDRLSLVLMHLAVGAVLIPGLSRTAQPRAAAAPSLSTAA